MSCAIGGASTEDTGENIIKMGLLMRLSGLRCPGSYLRVDG